MRILITGAGRGLGREFTRRYLERGEKVWAGVRDLSRAPEIAQLREAYPHRLTVLPLEVTDPVSVAQAQAAVAGRAEGLDLLINNAGMDQRRTASDHPESAKALGGLEAGPVLEVLHVNAVAPLLLLQQFLPLLRRGQNPKAVNISSVLGSISQKTIPGYYAYGASKAALNMFTRTLALDLAKLGVVIVSLHPGWVRTDLGGPQAPLTPAESVAGMMRVMDGLGPGDNGRFFDYQGQEVAW